MKTRKSGERASTREASSGAKWEYQVVRSLNPKGRTEEAWGTEFSKQLSDLGSKGWDLCAQGPNGSLVFKRPG